MKQTRQIMSIITTCLASGAVLLITGCKTTFQTRGEAKPSAFLGDVSQLHEGKSGEAKLVYVNPTTVFRNYTKIQLDPVVLVAENAKSSSFSSMSKEDRQAVVNFVDAKIREKLGNNFVFVKEAGPGIMRMRVAVTEAKGASVVLDTLSSIIPVGLAISIIKDVATGTHSAVGRAGVEMELKDSVTGERLAAAVDERAGRKYTFRFDKFSRYRTIDDSFDYWTTRLQERMVKLLIENVQPGKK